MKKHLSVSLKFAIIVCLMLLGIYSARSQANFNGTWEGIFMNDFRTVITFNLKLLTFAIPAKETNFAGSFNDSQTELSGEFTFPDGSKHPIHLKRKMTQENTLEEFRSVKQNKLDGRELQSDLLFLYTSLKEHHPQPYAFAPKDSLDLLYERLKEEAPEPGEEFPAPAPQPREKQAASGDECHKLQSHRCKASVELPGNGQ